MLTVDRHGWRNIQCIGLRSYGSQQRRTATKTPLHFESSDPGLNDELPIISSAWHARAHTEYTQLCRWWAALDANHANHAIGGRAWSASYKHYDKCSESPNYSAESGRTYFKTQARSTESKITFGNGMKIDSACRDFWRNHMYIYIIYIYIYIYLYILTYINTSENHDCNRQRLFEFL